MFLLLLLLLLALDPGILRNAIFSGDGVNCRRRRSGGSGIGIGRTGWDSGLVVEDSGGLDGHFDVL